MDGPLAKAVNRRPWMVCRSATLADWPTRDPRFELLLSGVGRALFPSPSPRQPNAKALVYARQLSIHTLFVKFSA